VLVLRAGIGPYDPLSRRAVADRLDTTTVQVARSERRGIVELRAAARAGRCGGGPAAAMPGETSASRSDASGAAAPAGGSGPGGGGTEARIGAAEPEGRTGVKEEFRSSEPASPPTRILRFVDDAPPLLLVLVLAFLAGFGAVWTFQRHGGGRRRVA
jgi:hypothetical protein